MKFGWKSVIASLIAINLFTGCMEPPSPQEVINRSSDKVMANAVAKYSNSYNRNPDLIIKQVYISGDKGHVDGSFGAVRGEYRSKYFVLTEPMTQAYIKAAKKRGHIVKVYKNSVSKVLGLRTPKVFSLDSSERAVFDWDPALIEFDKDGNIVSILIQKHKISYVRAPMRAYLHYRYSIIVTGQTAQRLIYTVGNDVLNNGYIKTL